MDLSYCECTVKRADRKYKVIKYLWILITAYLFFFNLFIPKFQTLTFSIVILLDIMALILLWPNFSAEYEYVFCDGQIDFDIIRSGRKRKTLKRIDLVDSEIICGIYNEDKLRNYQNFRFAKSYVSGRNYKNAYYIVIRTGNDYERIMFEPNEKMLNCIKNKAPRKTFINETEY